MHRPLLTLLVFGLVLAMMTGCAPSNAQKLRSAAMQGDPESQFQLALAYEGGVGVPHDLQEAAKWYRAAAEQGHVEAQYTLGGLYQAGEGVPQDYGLARVWYEKAANHGNAAAMNSLAYLYDLGLGVPPSPKLAARLYEQAAELGELRAMLNLGILLTEGKTGVDKDYVEAYKWLELARFYSQLTKNLTVKYRVSGELNRLSAMMTQAQIEDGKKRADAWDQIHRKNQPADDAKSIR